MQGDSVTRHDHDPRLDLLCVFAVLNPFVVQIAFFPASPYEPFGLSIPQIFQGTAFLVGIAIVLWSRWSSNNHTTRMSRFFLFVVVASMVFLVKTLMESNGIPAPTDLREDFIFYFKMIFWSSSWCFVAIFVRHKDDAQRLLCAVLLGASLVAVIVVICYVTGAGTIAVYAREGIRASVGASGVSAKQTVVYLASCAFVAIYLGKKAHWLFGLVVALILITSTLLSYDRAVQVGLVLACLWLLLWRLVLSDGKRSLPSVRLIILVVLGVVTLVGSLGYQSFYARWTADFEKGRPGSGRLEFYRVAWQTFFEAPAPDLLLGIGYSGVKRTMKEQCGMKIHTHSDLFDLLLGGGILGLGIYAVLFWSLAGYLRGIPPRSAEFASMGAVGSIYVVMSLITGLLEATHAMFCLGAIFHCCHILASHGSSNTERQDPNHALGGSSA